MSKRIKPLSSLNLGLVVAAGLVVGTCASSDVRAAAMVGWTGPDSTIIYQIGELVVPTGAASARGEIGQPLDFALALDSSGSMRGARAQAQKDAANALVTNIPALDTRGAVIDFDGSARVTQSLTPLATGLSDIVDAINATNAGGSTDIRDGIDAAAQELLANSSPTNSRQIVLITDGGSNEFFAVDAATRAANAGVTVNTVALPGGQTDILQNVADAGGGLFTDFSDATDFAALIDAFATGRVITGLDRVEITLPDGTTIVVPTNATGRFSVPAFALTEGVNTFVATAFGEDGTIAEATLSLTAVPVPAALPLFASALGALAYLRRRRARRPTV